jgi:predicted regulator of Ras-like GTPase activity (Roadblock/LC7/MglB family)
LRRSTGMTFLEIFEEMHRKENGMTSGALAGVDGLTIEEWRAPGDKRDLSSLCAEVIQFFRDSDRISSENGLGASEEVHIGGDLAQIFIRKVAEEYFLVIITDPGTVPGKCRFLLRQAARRTGGLL